MASTFHFNYWVLQAQSVLVNLERVNSGFDSFDHSELVLTYDRCDENTKEMLLSDLTRIMRIGKLIQTNDSLLLEAQVTANKLLAATSASLHII